MIGRIWHGWTRTENADAYERLLVETILPGIEGTPGYREAMLLRRVEDEARGEVVFITMTVFDTLEDAHGFSHAGPRGAVVPPDARKLLERFDAESDHYEIVQPAPGMTDGSGNARSGQG